MNSITLIIVAVLIFVLYKYGTKNFNYWRNKGVKQLKTFPFLGSHYNIIFRKTDALQMLKYFYDSYKNCGYGGIYFFDTPFLVIADVGLLKQIMVKDYEYFINRYDWGKSDELMSKNLSALKDESWKKMRSVLTTVFTSSKMKDMFTFMDKCGRQSAEYIENKILKVKSGKEVVEMDLKDFFSRYSTDVIATTAFGIEIDSFHNPENEFYKAGVFIRKSFQGEFIFKMLITFLFPKICKMFNVSLLGDKFNKFFIDVISETIKERELKNIVRKDVIHILMEARKDKDATENGDINKGKLTGLTDLDIAAQAIIFFFAGFETVSSLMSFACYELALNPDIQEKLHEEIDEVITQENGITYEGVVHKMTYLNMVLYECLRKYPPATLTDRVASKSYEIPKTDKYPKLKIEKGENLLIPIVGMHYDPEHFPNPEKFDPERFRDEKATIKPLTFMAFGEGPRHCIGFRYALMETKCILVHILKNFTIVPSEKTQIPMKLSKKTGFMLMPENGFLLNVKKRDNFYA